MYRWLFVVILILPIIEIWAILQVGEWLGGWTTFLMILATGIAGAYFARLEGRKVWLEARRQMETGQMPGRSLIDGLCVLLGGLLLLIPGFLSDIAGIVLLLPASRPVFRWIILQWLEKRMRNGNFTIRRF